MMIRIDVHPTRETWYTWHICFLIRSTYAIRMLSIGSPRMWQPFTLTQQSWADSTALEKKDSWYNPQHAGWPICRSATQFLSQHNHWSSNESQASIDHRLYRFTRHISPACDQYIQYLLMRANPSVLNRHKRGLQPWRCRLFTSHSPPFPTDGPPLST
jgi:hypothetical protein